MRKFDWPALAYGAAALCMPSVLLFNLYNRNSEHGNIVFMHVALLALALAAAGLAQFLVLRRLAGGPSALIVMAAFWAGFWFFGAVRLNLLPGMPGGALALAMLGLVFGIFAALRFLKPPFGDFTPVFVTASLVLVAMFAANFAPALHSHVSFRLARAGVSDMGGMRPSHFEIELDGRRPVFEIRRQFSVDEGLPKPDIYWIHLDGAVSLGTFGRHWGVDRDDFRQALAERGFLLYEDAILRNAKNTYAAMPMLLSPDFYDNYWGVVLGSLPQGMRREILLELNPIMQADGVDYYEDILPYFEVFAAFLHAGYRLYGVNEWWGILDEGRITGQRQPPLREAWNHFLRSDLPGLLAATIPMPIAMGRTVDAVYLGEPGASAPRFEFFSHYETHNFSWGLFLPEEQQGLPAEVYHRMLELYIPAYNSALENALAQIDGILARNPDAVIVLQGDHGPHSLYTQEHLLETFSRENALEIAHSVFSAVRIPDIYGGLDAPLHPLNIGRELVNRFVGGNYALLGFE